jgi:hypothetical protein
MEKQCKFCQHFDRTLVNPEYGECFCVASKYYRDFIKEDEHCEQFFEKVDNEEKN